MIAPSGGEAVAATGQNASELRAESEAYGSQDRFDCEAESGRARSDWSSRMDYRLVFGLLSSISIVACGPARSQSPAQGAVEHFGQVEEIKYPWGWIRWMMSTKLDPGAAQTFGIVEIAAGQKNSLHMHPNCEEILYVLSGSCRHRIGDKTVVLKQGDLIRIPAGVPHQAFVLGNEPLRAVISYSSGDRQVVDLAGGKE